MSNKSFVVMHVHNFEDGSDCLKIIGVFSTQENAERAITELIGDPGFSDLPKVHNYNASDEENPSGDEDGFHIVPYELDTIHWKGGYVTV